MAISHQSNEPIPDEQGPKDARGVFGVWAPGEDAAGLARYDGSYLGSADPGPGSFLEGAGAAAALNRP